jgi:hypothetical protein
MQGDSVREGPLIGILGASGAVGGATAAAIERMGLGPLRLGGRDQDALLRLKQLFGGRAEAVAVDAREDASLARFCAGCRIIVSCAAVDARQRGTIAAAAFAAGADYVDPGGDDRVRARVAGLAALAGRVAIIGAGVHPGLSELIPRWLAAQRIEPPLILTSYIGTFDRMTPASAHEFVLSLAAGHGGAHAMWRAGARHAHALEPLHEVDLPFFPPAVLAYPYLTADAERLARRLSLDEARCYYVFDAGGNILAILSRLQERLRAEESVAALADDLIRAVGIEMFGRRPVQRLVFQLDGQASGRPASRVAVLQASSTYELTATVVTMAVSSILACGLPAGAHLAAEALDPQAVSGLGGRPGVTGLHLLDQPLTAYGHADQGVV